LIIKIIKIRCVSYYLKINNITYKGLQKIDCELLLFFALCETFLLYENLPKEKIMLISYVIIQKKIEWKIWEIDNKV